MYDTKILDDYRDFTRDTAIYDSNDAYEYTIMGLCSEAGEVAGKFKKFIRDGTSWEDLTKDMTKELGDVLWYVDRIADEFNISVADILSANIEKLAARKLNDTLGGSGDDR